MTAGPIRVAEPAAPPRVVLRTRGPTTENRASRRRLGFRDTGRRVENGSDRVGFGKAREA